MLRRLTMPVRSSFTSRLAGGAFAAGALYLLGSRRRRRKAEARASDERPRARRSEPRLDPAATAPKGREIGAVEIGELPSDLSLHEIYQRVSFT